MAAAAWTNQNQTSPAATTATPNPTLPSTNTAVITEADIKRQAEYAASMYAKTEEERVAYVQYYENYYREQVSSLHASIITSSESFGQK